MQDGRRDIADAGDETQTQDFLPCHQNAEYISPAEPGEAEEDDGVGKNLRGIDEVEATRKGAEQTNYGVCCQVERQRQGQRAHFVESHGKQNTLSAIRCQLSGWYAR